jgi:glycerate kinase
VSPTPHRILIAPDKFKGTLPASEVAACLSDGIRLAAPDAVPVVLPVADGGDGTLDLALASGYTAIEVTAADALGQPCRARIAVRATTAVIELAGICGLQKLPPGERYPELCATKGLGVAIGAALDMGAREVVIGLGGSASTDGGAGMLVGLGAKLFDEVGCEVEPVPHALRQVARIDLAPVIGRLQGVRLLFAVDVSAPLLGATGAAAVFAAQKGADHAGVARLEAAMEHWSEKLRAAVPTADPATPGAGAAGGTGFAGLALGGELRSGAQLCLDLANFDTALAATDLVLTGEGRLDEQTLLGKAPAEVAARARSAGIPVIAVVGSRSETLSDAVLKRHGFTEVHELVEVAPTAADDVRLSRQGLHDIGRRIGASLCQSPLSK